MHGPSVTLSLRPSRRGDATWEILDRFPRQGDWNVTDYLALPGDGPLIELNEGLLEVLPKPDWMHQAIAVFLFNRLHQLRIAGQSGRAVLPPFNLRTVEKNYRHPDVMYLAPTSANRFRADFWEFADLVIEVMSGSKEDRDRDLVEKRAEYAAAGIPEYWIVDPAARTILVLALEGSAYREDGTFGEGTIARSAALAGFEIDVAQMFSEAEPTPPG